MVHQRANSALAFVAGARCLAGGRWDGGRPARDRCDWRPRPWPARVAVVVAWRASRRGHSALRAPATSRWALAWCSRPGAGRRRFGAGCLLARSPIAATCSPSPGASQQALVSAPRPRWSRACPPACRWLLPGGSYADQARHPSGQVIGSGLRPACPAPPISSANWLPAYFRASPYWAICALTV